MIALKSIKFNACLSCLDNSIEHGKQCVRVWISQESRGQLNPEELANLKSKSTCHECKKKGHSASDRTADGAVKPDALVFDQGVHARRKLMILLAVMQLTSTWIP